MLRIAICDDELYAREALEIGLENILKEDSEKIVYEFSSGETAVKWLSAHPGEIDLLFLDVEMKELNGMDAARKIRRFDENLMIVFVTGYTDYVFEGYQVNALDYLIKPPDKIRLKAVMERIRRQLESKEQDTFIFHNTEGTFRFPIKDIEYFYSDRRQVRGVYLGREYPFYGKLDEVEKNLKGKFVRTHQRYLVNPDKVSHIGSAQVILEGKKIPISRSMKEEATRKLAMGIMGGEDSVLD